MADLSEEEHDIDIESEDDDEKATGLAFMSEAEKKAHHNALERKRRDQIKESFIRLRDAIPDTYNEKSSRAIILKSAIDYIRQKTEKNRRGTKEVEEMKRRVEMLKKQLESVDQRVLSEHSDASEDNLEQHSFYYNNNNNNNNSRSHHHHHHNNLSDDENKVDNRRASEERCQKRKKYL